VSSIELPDNLVGLFAPPESRAELTEEESRNIELVIALRFAPYADRPSFHHAGAEPPLRTGLAALDASAKEHGKKGRLPTGLSDRFDEFIDIIAKGDRVWTVFQVTGRHTADLWGYAPTGHTLSFLEFGIYRLANGKIAEAWYFGDELGVINQLKNRVAEATT
jgi:hypothetical protein